MIKVPFVPSFRLHFFVGLFTALWLVFFLIFIGPFDVEDLSMKVRFILLPGYGIVCLFSYVVISVAQLLWYKRSKSWNIFNETAIILLYAALCFGLCYAYYKSDWMNGEFSFARFSLQVFLPTLFIILPILVGSRWAVTKFAITRERKQSLSSSDLKEWKSKMELLIAEGTFLSPEITLKDTARLLNTNTSVVSKIVNHGYELNFNDFVNKIRIEEIVKKMKAGEHRTITLSALGESVGFNSTATFNRAFRKFMDQSPSQYLKSLS